MSQDSKQITQVTSEGENLWLGETKAISPVVIDNLLLADRKNWDQEQYQHAIKSAILVKGLSQWCIGLFTYETLQKWSHLTYGDIAHELDVKPSTLEMYTQIYAYYAKYQREFTPPNEYSFEFLRMVAIASRKLGKDPVKELARLADKGIVQNAKAAYRDIHRNIPVEERPPLPEIVTLWDPQKKKFKFKIVGSKESKDLLTIFPIDYSEAKQSIFEVTGKQLEIYLEDDEIKFAVEPTKT